jgi:hypothetical protein
MSNVDYERFVAANSVFMKTILWMVNHGWDRKTITLSLEMMLEAAKVSNDFVDKLSKG